MKNKKVSNREKKAGMSFIKSITAGTGAGMAVWALLVFAASYIISGFDEPESLIVPAVFILGAISSLSSGIVCTKLSGICSLFPGTITGIILLALVFLLSLLCADTSYQTSFPLKVMLSSVFVIFGLIGAKLALPAKKSKRNTRK